MRSGGGAWVDDTSAGSAYQKGRKAGIRRADCVVCVNWLAVKLMGFYVTLKESPTAPAAYTRQRRAGRIFISTLGYFTISV